MAKVRKDLRGRSLRKGEVQRSSDKRYMYTYTDPMGRRKFIYANDLTELREKEAKLMKDQLDGLDLYVAGKASVNDTFDRYMSTKYNLRESTRSSYFYTYDHYVRDTFGNKRIAEIKYSDVLQFYYYLLNEVKISLGTLDTVHCLLHPTFQLAVRDEIIRNNPTDGVMKEISRESGKKRNQTCIDRRAAKSIHGIHCEPSDILSLVAYVYGVAWNRVQNWRSIRASMARFRL